jgi:hypothetical protein
LTVSSETTTLSPSVDPGGAWARGLWAGGAGVCEQQAPAHAKPIDAAAVAQTAMLIRRLSAVLLLAAAAF